MNDAVLVMAYGTPRSLEDVEAYYMHIRGGRPPTAEALAELIQRYQAIGGRSPLAEITSAQAAGIAKRAEAPAYIGYKHSFPFIEDAVEGLRDDGIERAVGLVLAPHYSRTSIGDYERRVLAAAKATGWDGTLLMVESWYEEEDFIELLARRVTEALRRLPEDVRAETTVLFSAHSLPLKAIAGNDPYPEQLRATADAVARRARLERWDIAWQSAGATDDEWLGPDVLEMLVELSAKGARGVIVCPCGFTADHLEVLYDLDVEAATLATELGIAFARTASPNDDPAFLDMLGEVVTRRLTS